MVIESFAPVNGRKVSSNTRKPSATTIRKPAPPPESCKKIPEVRMIIPESQRKLLSCDI